MVKKNMMIHFVSCCVLCLGLILCRFVFFELHGMKDWPFCLFLFCFIIIAVSFGMKTSLIPIFTSLSYIVGFVVGLIFQTDSVDPGGGRINNLWIIWTVIIICAIIASVFGEIIKRKISKNNS